MNERIKEIWGKAWNAYIGPDGILDGKDADDFYEKFAELLVKECADLAKHHVMNISTYADAEFIEKQIAENFGVKE